MAEIAWPWQYNFPPFFTFNGISWRYINEGNVHIVLEVTGTAFALRLIKEDDNPLDLNCTQNFVDFVNLVMIPMFYDTGSKEIETLLEIPQEELLAINNELLKYRPKHRISKSRLSHFVIKVPNLTIVSLNWDTNYCIELKPKQGFMGSRLNNYGKCYYCLKQCLKLQENKIDRMSKYCPLDLYSGDKRRMWNAVRNLIDQPQNNLKMFKNGNIIFHESSSLLDLTIILNDIPAFGGCINSFIQFIVEVLVNDNKNPITIIENKMLELPSGNRKQCVPSRSLKEGSMLNKIIQLQILSENYNIKSENFGSIDKYEYVKDMLNLIQNKNLNLFNNIDKDKFFQVAKPVHLAMLSAIAKDCSIMISFSPNYSHEINTGRITINDNTLSYKVAVTDLEPKPITTLFKRNVTEAKLLEAYKNVNKSIHNESEIQVHSETRAKQLEAWQQLITDYLKANKLSTLDIRESQNGPLFNNTAINRKLSQESILTVLENMARNGKAAPTDKSKNLWEVYWHSLDEWGNMLYSWASVNGMNNSVCTLFELREGDNTVGEEFHGLDMNVLLKALKSLESKGKCELMNFDDNQGVKFF